MKIMQVMALSSALIYAGCWAATLSTALTNLLSVPRLIQALGLDRIYPGLIFFSKPYGKYGEPYRGYVLTFTVSLFFLLIGELNTIAPMITNFYLASYALINFCTFHASIIHHINWRPTFRFYNTWVSFFGFLMCILIMMIISWMMALVTVLIFLGLFLLVLYRKLDVNWPSSTDAQRYNATVSALVQMYHMKENIKAYNPQVLVLAGRALLRPALLDIGQLITRNSSFMIVADINEVQLLTAERAIRCQMGEDWIRSRKDRGFFVLIDGCTFESGVRTLIHATGLGPLKPNILLLGFQSKWARHHPSAVKKYVSVIQLAYEQQIGIAILRVQETVRPLSDSLQIMPRVERTRVDHSQILDVMREDSTTTTVMREETQRDEIIVQKNDETPVAVKDEENNKTLQKNSSSKTLMQKLKTYKRLTFNSRIQFAMVFTSCKFIEMSVIKKKPRSHTYRMATVLGKLRIEYSSLTIIQGLNDEPKASTVEFFDTLIKNFRTDPTKELYITDAELERMQANTNRYLRLRELIMENSWMSSLIVVTLPLPRKNKVSPALYMSWLETLSKDLPPVFFVRGSDSVLGF